MAVPVRRHLRLGRLGPPDPLIVPDFSSDTHKGQPGLTAAALRALCPHCGASSLFDGPVQLVEKCSACGLDLSAFSHTGGRLGALLTFLVAGLLIVLAFGTDALFAPPLWVHVLVWGVLTPLAVIAVLRRYMAVRVAMAYRKLRRRTEDQ